MNHPKLMSNYPVHQVPSVKWWSSRFERVEPPRTNVKLPCTPGLLSQMVVQAGSKGLTRTTPNSCQTTLYTRFLQSNGGRASSKGLNHPELMSSYPNTRFPQSNGGSSRFEGVEPPQTHVKLPCTPCSLSQTVVRAGSKGLNHPKLMSNYPVHPVPSVKQWFELVRRG